MLRITFAIVDGKALVLVSASAIAASSIANVNEHPNPRTYARRASFAIGRRESRMSGGYEILEAEGGKHETGKTSFNLHRHLQLPCKNLKS